MVKENRRRKRSRSRSRSPDRARRSKSRERNRRSRSKERRRSRERKRSEKTKTSIKTVSSSLKRKHGASGRRSRSRERERRRRRSRSRGRRSNSRSPDRQRDRRRFGGRDRSEDRRRDSDGEDEKFDSAGLDKEAEQKHLDLEMQKRRDRIEKWRADRKKRDAGEQQLVILPTSKKWSLEDDDDEELLADKNKDHDNGEGKEDGAEEDVDPLDAFMQGVQEEVRQINVHDHKRSGKPPATDAPPGQNQKVMMVSGVAKSKEEKKKGELIEQDQDALEYSSEEEKEDLQTTMSGLQSKQKKLLQAVDHQAITYEPYRKNFYIEVPEIANMTKEEVDDYLTELEGIKVKGKGCPRPIKTWAQCGVSKKVLDILKKCGYEKPTPIQAQAIPAVMSGRDVIGIAKTGSGKTIAFLLPMFRHIMDQPQLESEDGPISIIMTPTRELAMQIVKDCKRFTKSLGLRAVCVYGGTGISEQIAELKRGAEIIVCTPGRMIDMLAANSGRVTNVKRCTYVVLDEADRMFDMGFEPQVMRIVDNVRPDRQTVMFSATFPRQMEALARRVLNKPVEIQIGGRSVVCKDVEQHIVVIDDDQKFLKLLELLGFYQEQGSILIFVDKQEHADELLKDLMSASYNCMALHGGIDQFDRDSTIVDFKSGKVKLMIATSVAARGLDVKHLILVINYDCPNHYEDYVHRCGRTGRAGNKGHAYTFITSEQGRYAADIIRGLEQAATPVPAELQQVWDDYKAKTESEGKQVKIGGGFSGKGFKFDEAEAQLPNERKKLQKAVLGLQDSDDEDAEDDIDQQIEKMLDPKRRVKEITAPVGGQPAPIINTTAGATPGSVAAPVAQVPGAFNAEKLEMARLAALKINRAKNLEGRVATQQTAEAIMKGEVMQNVISAKTIAEQLAEKLNAKLNYQPKGDEETKEEEQQTEVFHKYEEELEINDFPQQARWRVTSKEALAQISEYSEAGITVRGTYYPQGKDAKDGERKLYLAIESTSDRAVSKAKAEITRLIKEELVKLQTSYHPINRGRYKVV